MAMMIGDYVCQTTFWDDFSIADQFGVSAVKDTYERAFNEWKTNYVYLTELVMILNHKCWQHYDCMNKAASKSVAEHHEKLSKLYEALYYETYDKGFELLTGDELAYYIRTLD